jgi:hypothetical protein
MSTRKGKKGLRDVPIFYTQKKRKHGICLTDIAWEALNELAHQQGVSVSEFIERWARAEIGKNSVTLQND